MGIIFVLVTFLTGVGLIWWIVELWLINKRLREYNNDVALNLARELKLMTA